MPTPNGGSIERPSAVVPLSFSEPAPAASPTTSTSVVFSAPPSLSPQPSFSPGLSPPPSIPTVPIQENTDDSVHSPNKPVEALEWNTDKGSDHITWSNPLSSRGSFGSLNVLPAVEEQPPPPLRTKVDEMINEGFLWALVVMVLTLWALYADDIKRLSLPKDTDAAFSILNWVILGVFVMEFATCCCVQKGYILELQALMDFLAVISLVPLEDLLRSGDVGGDISVARVARGARAFRILRATRAATMALKSQKQFRNARMHRRRVKGAETGSKKSVLEETLVQRTNVKMLLGILVLLIGTSMMEYTEIDRTAETGLELLDRMYVHHFDYSGRRGVAPNSLDAPLFNDTWADLLETYRSEVEHQDGVREVMVIVVGGNTYLSKDTDELRDDELQTFEASDLTLVDVNIKKMRQIEAAFSIGLTTFTVLGILLWTGSFSRDHRMLVIEPVNRMIQILRTMSKDPRLAIDRTMQFSERGGEATTEIDAIELCVHRFGQLLKVGFGEAGLDVISKNLDLEGGRFDPMVPGTTVWAIFGFCDIRNFTDCCEVLNEETMLFTNRIASIVHELVEESGGSVNKNIGDAFLSVWKLRVVDEEEVPQSFSSNSLGLGKFDPKVPGRPLSRRSSHGSSSQGGGNRYRHHLTDAEDVIDLSLRAFIKMQAQLKKSRSIQKLCRDPRLQAKIPGFTVKMGYGLHLGWAVEGAVGSKHKVDATYLSPNVNMASRLEAATKQYGVTILMSNTVIAEMSEELRRECRPVDRVTVKGSTFPIGLWVHMPTEAPQLQHDKLLEFMRIWEEVFHMYVAGNDWMHALGLIAKCKDILPDDGPCEVLREVMEDHGGVAPAEWPGYHQLTSK